LRAHVDGQYRLVVASASPRRQALVALLGQRWRAAPADLDEDAYLVGEPGAAAVNVALAKAGAVAAFADADEVVLAADTLVVIEGDVLAKPADAPDARRMLARLRGRAHHVLSGVALQAGERQWAAVVDTRVLMRAYADDEVMAYIARGEPFDKAGGYAIQDEVFRPVERLEGCYLNVVGLPLCAVVAGLATLGVAANGATPRAGPPPCELCRAGAPLVSIRSAY
jgi:nucleoside triphosphate pyrophosphatase